MEKYSELIHVPPWNETTILSLGIERHQIPDVLLFRFWTCDFSSFWGDSAALHEALPKWIISKAAGICNSREWCLWCRHLMTGCLVLLLATFWRHSGYDSFWLWLSTHNRQQPSCQREIGMKEKSSHWGLSEFFSASTPVKRSYSTRKDEEGWGTDLYIYLKRSICIHVYTHMYVCVYPYLFFKQSLMFISLWSLLSTS